MDRAGRIGYCPKTELPICSIAAAAIGAAGSVVGGVVQSGAAKSAAQTQSNAALQAAQIQNQQFQQTQGYLAPYRALGAEAAPWLAYMTGVGPAPGAGGGAGAPSPAPAPTGVNWAGMPAGVPSGSDAQIGIQNALTQWTNQYGPPTPDVVASIYNQWGVTPPGQQPTQQPGTGVGQMAQQDQMPSYTPSTAPLTAPFQPTMTQLSQTPGYQFTLQQGEQAVTNQLAAQGLGAGPQGPSGPGFKGAINYAEGLAGTTFQQQFNNYLAQNQQIYNMLAGMVSTGGSAAAGTGQLGMQYATNVGNLLTSAGAAQAAGQVGSATALTSGFTGGLSNVAQMYALSNVLNQFGGQGGGPAGGLGNLG